LRTYAARDDKDRIRCLTIMIEEAIKRQVETKEDREYWYWQSQIDTLEDMRDEYIASSPTT